MEISLVIPCRDEEEVLKLFYQKVIDVLEELQTDYEMLFVDDGSSDATLFLLKEFSKENQRVRYLSLSRNFGKEAAMYAGMCAAKGEYVAVMDADLQDPPELLVQMAEILHTGDYDSVATRRLNRAGEPPVRSFFARCFYLLMNGISDVNFVDGARDFRMMKRNMVDAIIRMAEYNRFSKGIFNWVGFRTYWISYENIKRPAGKTKWSFWKLLRYAMEGVVNFSQVPLYIASWLGIGISVFAFFAIVFIVIRRFFFGDPVAGWASTMCVVIFMGGIQLLCLGILGQYLAKTYMETKKRPHYIVADTNVDGIDLIG